MAVEEHRLDASKKRVTAVKMTPARLNHADGRIGKEMDGALEQVRLGDEICVEDANVFALGRGEPRLEGAGLEPGPVGSMNQFNIEPATLQFGHARRGQLTGIVRRIVEDLNLEPIFRIIDLTDRPEKALHHVDFIEDRQLHRHVRQLLEPASRHRRAFPMLQEQVNDYIPMDSVSGEAEQHAHVAHCPDDRGEASLHNGLEKLPRRILRSRAT